MEKSLVNATCARVCRLCLCSRGEILPLFSSGSDPDSGLSLLASKIHACVSVEITEDDRLPNYVCKKCVNNVNNWYSFKKVCVESQAKLQDWLKNDINIFEKVADIKKEPFFDETNDNEEDILEDCRAASRGIAGANAIEKIHPEGPPILASLGLAPRSEKETIESDDEDDEEEDKDFTGNDKSDITSATEDNSLSNNHSSTLQVSQLASKDCLVCGRAYRYSHNARRHELTAHNYDRYTNKIKGSVSKLKPNPFNPKARLLPNPNNPKSHLFSKLSEKFTALKNKSRTYPIRIKALSDLQKTKRPEILKTLLSAQPELLVSEPEILQSGPESPETLVSEPEISSYHVETIIAESESIENNDNISDEEESHVNTGVSQNRNSAMVEIDSDNELEIAREMDINKIIGVENGELDTQENENSEQITPDINETSQDFDDERHQNDVETDEPAIQDEEMKCADVQSQNDDYVNDDGIFQDDDDMPLVPIAPIVEINEEPTANSFSTDANDESKINEDEEDQYLRVDENASRTVLTKTQKEFIDQYRDIIEQINTKECHCCHRVHPRRKAVIQHLQKNGLKIPKHTCYNCVITFGHIGALLSHMRANVCTDLWKIIYKEGGITEDMLTEEELVLQAPEAKFQSCVNESVNKGQYKDLLNARSYACKLCPAKFQLKLFVMKHVIDIHENGISKIPLLCQHCGYRFKENRLWKKHTRNGECTVNISCDLCPERFRNMFAFNEHAMAVHAESFLDQSIEYTSKAVDGKPTECNICNKNMSSYLNLVKHLKNVHNEEKPHMCRHCSAKFELVSDLNHHIYLEHNEHGASVQNELNIVKQEVEECHYTCTDCNCAFESVDAFTDHQIAIHGQEAHQCDQCNRKFLQISDLNNHKNTHLKVKFYSCTICSNSYSTMERLNDHMSSSHSDNFNRSDSQFYCDICVRSFKSRQAFSNHMRIHAKVPTHNKRAGETRSPSTYSTRIIKPNPVYQDSLYTPYQKQIASFDAPYSCDICGKGFMHKKNIWKHKKVLHPEVVSQMKSPDRYISLEYPRVINHHTEEEDDYGNDENSTGLSIPQFDSFTAAAFEPYDNGILEDTSYKCDICGKKFTAQSGMWKHKRIKHGIVASKDDLNFTEPNRTTCTICKITFSDKKSYYRHRKNVHKVSTQMCKICGKHLNSALELYEHLKAAHARELLGYNANQGGSKQNEVENLQEYSDEDAGGEDAVMKMQKIQEYSDGKNCSQSDAYQARYPCDSCGKQFLGLLALQNHQCKKQFDDNETFDCEICHKSYTSISALKSHRGWHLRSPDGKAAANNSGLWMPHNKVTNKVSKHEVMETLTRRQSTSSSAAVNYVPQLKRKLPPEVEVTIVNPDKKKRIEEEAGGAHLMPRSTTSSDDRYCNICDKEFTKRAAYQRHMEEVHQPNSVFCPVCDKSFTRKSTLLVHMRKHYDSDEAYEASDIAAGLGTVDAMVDFVTNSQNTNIYPCDICGVHYRSSKSLRRHRIRRHADIFTPGGTSAGSMSTILGDDFSEDDEGDEDDEDNCQTIPIQGPGEFTCTQCGDGVASPRDLIIHRQMHNTPSKFHCNVCRVYFARAIDLSAHTRARHADNDKVFFPCAMCDRFYMNKKSLQRHIENAH